jgi:hypothetical protein
MRSILGLRLTLLVGAAAPFVLSGCSESKEDAPLADEADLGGETDEVDPPSSPSLDAMVPRADATVIVPPDASDGAVELADTGVAIPPVQTPGTTDGGGIVLLPPLPPGVMLPTDGNRLAACYADADCTGANLSCVHSLGLISSGYCYDKCSSSEECPQVDGSTTVCSIEGQCVFDCRGNGLGDGACPSSMVCRNIVPGLAVPIFRCEYPYGSGGKITPAFGQCDRSHGSNDCAGDLICHVPISGIVTPGIGPGYCAPTCSADPDCQVPAGTTAAASCSLLGRCELDCSTDGASCPTGMQCVDADNAALITAKRCRYPLPTN